MKMINFSASMFIHVFIINIHSSASSDYSPDKSEAILNWERPSNFEQFSDEDDLLIKRLSSASPGTYQYKPSTDLQLINNRDQGNNAQDDEDDNSDTLASHLTKLAASSSNNFNNYQPQSMFSPPYQSMDVVPLEYLKHIKDLDNIDPSLISRHVMNKRRKSMASMPRKLSLNEGKRKSKKKMKNPTPTKKSINYQDEDEIPDDGSSVSLSKHPVEGLKVIRRVQVPDWTYEDEDKWGKSHGTCEGINQSPINIHPKSIVEETGLSLLFMNSYRQIIEKAHLVNNGRTLEVEFGGGPRPAVTGSALFDDVFLFQQLHFHWGSKNTIGSEHAVFGQKFAMELHLVHFNEKYGNFENAATKPDGLAVIAVFFQVTAKDNPRFDDLINSLKEVNCGGDTIDFNHKISVSFLLPSNRNEFYRYSGSLTTPPCTESVTWVILKHGLLIGRNQLKTFRNLKQGDCRSPILNNWRNIQPVNGRKVDKTSVSSSHREHNYVNPIAIYASTAL